MKYYTDGWLKGSKNPSPYGGGWTVVDEDNNLIRFVNIEQENFTNNEAEIKGILEALRLCDLGDEISTDSMCCFLWVNKGKSKARPDFHNLLQEAHNLMKEKYINLMWEGRDFNKAGIYNEQFHEEQRLFRKQKNGKN